MSLCQVNNYTANSLYLIILLFAAGISLEQAVYVVGERCGTLTVRVRRGGYLSNTATVGTLMLEEPVSA